MSHHPFRFLLAAATLAAAVVGQNNDLLVTYSQNEQTFSGSGGTVLRFLKPNEIAQVERTISPCVAVVAEKWAPLTCFHTMAGDENGDTDFWNPALFGRIDALCVGLPMSPVISTTSARTVFWSVSAPMGNAISTQPFRPGDVARIVRTPAFVEGQVEYFMRREQFNAALGLPLTTPIDVDAIAWSPNYGVYFSLDIDTPGNGACGPAFYLDGDVLCVPAAAITWTPDMRVGAVLPASVYRIYTEAQMDAFVLAAQVTNRFGTCLSAALDTESLEIDWTTTGTSIVTCFGTPLAVPDFLFTTETMTGASLLTTAGGGQIYNQLCQPSGTSCGFGPTMGPQMGIQAAGLIGAPSYLNALATTFTCRHVLEPQQHVLNVFPLGAPLGATQIDYHSPFLFNVALIEIVSPVIPGSFPAAPWSPLCFPDLYAPSLFVHCWPVWGAWGSFPMVAIPPLWQGKVLYQNVGFGTTLELSTPAVIDVK